jgi:hypothetical protein
MADALALLWGISVLALLLWLRTSAREAITAVRDLTEQVQKDRQQVMDLLSVRLPGPSREEIRERAKRLAEKFAREQEALALRAFHIAGLHQGAARAGELGDGSDGELTVHELGVLRRHLAAGALISQGWDPDEARKQELLGSEQAELSEQQLSGLSTKQRERAERLAVQFGGIDREQIEQLFESALIKKGALTS